MEKTAPAEALDCPECHGTRRSKYNAAFVCLTCHPKRDEIWRNYCDAMSRDPHLD